MPAGRSRAASAGSGSTRRRATAISPGTSASRPPRVFCRGCAMRRRRPERAGVIGAHEPYAGRDERVYSIEAHGERHGLPHVLIELRQDQIATPEGAAAWATRLARLLGPVLGDAALYEAAQP